MRYFFSFLKTRVYHVFYVLFLKRFGFGGRITKEVWEQEYAKGRWDYLASEDEKAHYIAIVKQIKQLYTNVSILDIGCGDGVLYNYFKNMLDGGFKYKGIDISDTAIKNALKKFPEADFQTVDYDFEHLPGQFSIVIFNESLNYFIKPVKTLLKANAENVAPDGVLIVSMWASSKSDIIWTNLNDNFKILTEDTVNNDKGQRWSIKTLKLAKK